MAGYDYEEGMSNNAVDAYLRGVMPLSKITTADYREAGVGIAKTFAQWLAREGYWRACEWHHTGGTYFNNVDFFDPERLATEIANKSIDVDKLYPVYLASKRPDVAPDKRVKGRYTLFNRSGRRARIVGHKHFVGTLKGNWIFIEGGGKKKANGNYITWSEI
jgi:hypothetical protein